MQATRQSILKLESPTEAFTGSVKVLFDYSVVIFEPPYGLTQTVTQTRKRPGSTEWRQWIAHRAESTQKRRKALRHNAFRRSSYLHTQEVTGSSPAVSTKEFLISSEIRNSFCLCLQIVTRHFGVFRLTQTVTQKPMGQESAGEGRMASSVPLRLFFVGYMVWLMTLPMVSAASRFIPSVAWV